MARQAEDGLGRIQRIDALLVRWRQQLAAAPSKLPDRAVELLVENPYSTANGLAKRLGVAFTTAQRAMDRLESTKIVERISDAKRNRVYCARALLDILEEPARLTASGRARAGPTRRS